MKKIFWFLFFLILVTPVVSQNIVTLEKQAKELFEMSKNYRTVSYDSIFSIAKKIEKLNENKISKKINAYKNLTLCLYYFEKSQENEAKKNAHSALNYFMKINDYAEIAFTKSILGRIYQKNSDYITASQYYFESNALAEKLKLNQVKIFNHKNLAFLFLDQQNISKALFYAEIAKKTSASTNNKKELGFSTGIIAEIYRTDKKENISNTYFEETYKIFEDLNFEYGKAWTLTNWSLLKLHNTAKGYLMRIKAQKIWDKTYPNNVMALANKYNIGYDFLDSYQEVNFIKGIKNFQIPKKQFLDSALFYFKKCLKTAEKDNVAIWRMYCYGSINEVYRFKNDIKGYAIYTEKYLKIKDSIFSQKNKNLIAEKESALEIQNKDNQLKINKVLLEAKEKQRFLYLGGIILLTIIGGLLFYQSRKRKQINQKLETLNQDLDQANKAKTRFFGILNHDLRGPVANLVFFLQLQQESPEMLDEESIKRMQNKTMTGAENLLSTMEDILQWSKSQMENFKPQPKPIGVNQLFDDTKKVFSGYLKIEFEYQNPDNIEVYTDENYLKTIIRNLTSNAINVFTNTKNPKIIWKAWQENNISYFSIQDNGPGASQEQFKALFEDTEITSAKSGLGLYLTKDMAKAIDCEITVDSKINVGTTFILKI